MEAPAAKAGMLIRRPVAKVFEAFVDPAVTTRFWFTRSSGRLEPGAKVRWDWEMYDAGDEIIVKAVEPDRRILIDWNSAHGPSEVEWTFEPRGDGRTWVEVENRGFKGDFAQQIEQAMDSHGGFELVLAAAKIWLEHGIEPNIVLDRHAAAVVEGWRDR